MEGQGALKFINSAWLEQFPKLTKELVMEYFYTSVFYDSSSNNEAIRALSGLRHHNERYLMYQNEMEQLRGIQYIVDETNMREPDLFIIKKIRRDGPDIQELLCVYYCLDGAIYQCPLLQDVIQTRTTGISRHLLKSFNEIVEQVEYTSNKGHLCWRSEQSRVQDAASKPSLTTNGKPGYNIPEFPVFNSVLEDIASPHFFEEQHDS